MFPGLCLVVGTWYKINELMRFWYFSKIIIVILDGEKKKNTNPSISWQKCVENITQIINM